MAIGATIAATVGAQIVGNIVQGAMQGQGAQQASGQQQQGYTNATNAINTNYGQAQNLLTNQYNVATPYITENYGNAISGFAPYRNAGGIARNEISRTRIGPFGARGLKGKARYNESLQDADRRQGLLHGRGAIDVPDLLGHDAHPGRRQDKERSEHVLSARRNKELLVVSC